MKTLKQYLDYQQNLHPKEIDLGLSRIKKVYCNIFPNGVNFKVITVAGTNGKGSTAGFLADIFYNAKISYGCFSSPHINTYNERFKINNKLATDDEIINAFDLIEEKRENISLSYFEFSTLAAIILFEWAKVEVAIMEVGLGGRLDSTNILDPDIAIITSIGLDHKDVLGDNLEQIAYEKAGIMRKDKPIITPKNIHPEIINQAKNKKAKLYLLDKVNLELNLIGEWQKFNANLAKKAAMMLYDMGENLVNNSLKQTLIPARFEKVKYKNKTYILDSAHNPDAVSNLATIILNNSVAIFAVMKDKDYPQIIELIKDKIKFWHLIKLDDKRALKPEELIKLLPNSKVYNSAVELINNTQKQNENNIIVFGSFLTISTIKQIIDYN